MANTTYLKGEVEAYVRQQLAAEYGIAFSAELLALPMGGHHEFDAVSADLSIVASIKSASGKTAGGRIPNGKIKDSIAELYFLSQVPARQRLLVLTNPEFFRIFQATMKGKLTHGIIVKHVELSPGLAEKVRLVQERASKEISVNRLLAP